eukprot:5203855-Pleurochrysis_carterae.AAC.2
MEGDKLLLKAIYCTAQVICSDHDSARAQMHAANLPENAGRIVASTSSGNLHNRRASRRIASGVTGVVSPLRNAQELSQLCERYPLPAPRGLVLFDRVWVVP